MTDQTIDFQATTYDKERGRVDYGTTTKMDVSFHTPFPNRPTVIVNGTYLISHTLTGFSLDRMPDVPLTWVAQEVPAIQYDIEDIRRMR